MNQEAGDPSCSRRAFLAAAGRTTGAVAAVTAAGGAPVAVFPEESPQTPTPQGNVIPLGPRQPGAPQQPVPLPPFKAKTERQSGPQFTPQPPRQRVGYAIVGLGRLSVEELLPAFGECEKSRLVALISGTPDKAARIATQYGVSPQNVYSYENYDRLKDNPDVEAVYVVLPNSMHEEFTVRAAKAGKHVLCEKPMANTVKQCENMIKACRDANRKLMIAYRIQYEPYNREARRMVRAREFGAVKMIEGVNGQNQGEPEQWRHKKALAGGGALPDIGLYCLNTTRFLLGEEPNEVFGMTYSTPGDPRFKEVEENCVWQMRFPSGVHGSFLTGYGHYDARRYRVLAETGWIDLDPAFSYTGIRMRTSFARGETGYQSELNKGQVNQFAREMDHFSDCVINDRQPFTPGEEGLQDQRIMDAIYESARSGKWVKLPTVEKKDAFRGPEPQGV